MKRWFQSKTIVVNGIAIVIMIAEYLITNQIYSPEIHAIVIAVLNLGLRLVTNTAVTK